MQDVRISSAFSSPAIPPFAWPNESVLHIVALGVRPRDAIGNFVLQLHRLFRDTGIPCRLYSRSVRPELHGLVAPTADVLSEANCDDVVFFHFSSSDPHLPALARLSCRKLVYYHNVTPPQLLERHFPKSAARCADGYSQLDYLKNFDFVLTNSETSRRELQQRLSDGGAHKLPDCTTAVCPPLLNLAQRLSGAAEPISLPEYETKLLFVGRLAPHKKVEHLLRLFAYYDEKNRNSALIIAGREASPDYTQMLERMIAEESPALRSRILFAGNVTDGQLISLYRRSSAFVTMSEHEGFCVPLVEAMRFDLPIFAFAGGAVAETLGRSGIVFDEKNFPRIAAEIDTVLRDPVRRACLLRAQRCRLAEIATATDGTAIWLALEHVLFRSHR